MTSILDRNTLPRKPVVINNYRPIAYTGPTPGADSAIYVLFNSTTAAELQPGPLASIFQDHKRYILVLKNSAAGTLNAYSSQDNGNTWDQYSTQSVALVAGTTSNTIYIPTEPHLNVKIEWVNGGSAQTTWKVNQGLDAETAVASSGGGSGGAVTVTSGTLTANQGTAAASSSGWPVKITDGTSVGAVKAASTPAVAADPAQVVTLSPNNQVQGVTTATSTASTAQAVNDIPLGKYNLTVPTLTDTQLSPLQLDPSGYLKGREQYAPVAEDNTNGVIATTKLPTAVSTYVWSVAFTAALATNLVVKGSAGVVRSISGRIDSTATSGTYYLQLNNAISASNGTVTPLMAPFKVQHVSGTNDYFSFDFTSEGIFASTGLSLALSTTDNTTLTLAGSFLQATALLK